MRLVYLRLYYIAIPEFPLVGQRTDTCEVRLELENDVKPGAQITGRSVGEEQEIRSSNKVGLVIDY